MESQGMEKAVEARNAALVEKFPACKSFFCVLTEKNWNSAEFFESQYVEKQWFCLSKQGVSKITDPATLYDTLLNPCFSTF